MLLLGWRIFWRGVCFGLFLCELLPGLWGWLVKEDTDGECIRDLCMDILNVLVDFMLLQYNSMIYRCTMAQLYI